MSEDSNQELMSDKFPAINSQISQAVEYTNGQVSSYSGQTVKLIADSLTSESKGLAADAARNYMSAIMQISVAAQAVWTEKLMQSMTTGQPSQTNLTDAQNSLNTMVNNSVATFGAVMKSIE